MYLTREANTGPLRVLPARELRPPQMRSTIRCGTPSEAGGHAPSKCVGVVPIIVDGVGVGLAIDQRPARVWDPKDVPEGEHRQRSLNQEPGEGVSTGRASEGPRRLAIMAISAYQRQSAHDASRSPSCSG